MKELKFYVCEHCGNIAVLVENHGVPLMCCGQKMTEIKPNTTDAAVEKHVPVVTVSGNEVKVDVSSVTHPMTEEHHIGWVYLETEKGGQVKYLAHTQAPEVKFVLENDKAVKAYAYCNLHGLWVGECK